MKKTRSHSSKRSIGSKGKEKKSKAASIGNNFVTFATIGFGLYVFSSVFKIQFERFLFLVFIFGTLLIVSRPDYNPRFSDKIPHNLTEEQLDVIRSFVESRKELNTGSDEKKKEAAFNELHKMSSVQLDELYKTR